MKFLREDNGFCRVYYRNAPHALYCWQQDSVNGPFILYVCSRDGEPSHESRLQLLPPPCPGETSTGRDFNAWLKERARLLTGELT